MNSVSIHKAVRLNRTIKFGAGENAIIYEEGLVLKPPLPMEIIREIEAGSPLIEQLSKPKPERSEFYDYVSEPEMKTPDMSAYKTTASTVTNTKVGNEDKPEIPKPKLIKRVKLIRRLKKP